MRFVFWEKQFFKTSFWSIFIPLEPDPWFCIFFISGSGSRKPNCFRSKEPEPDSYDPLKNDKMIQIRTHVSGFISLARVSTNSGINWSTNWSHSDLINLIGIKSQDPSSTSLNSSYKYLLIQGKLNTRHKLLFFKSLIFQTKIIWSNRSQLYKSKI